MLLRVLLDIARDHIPQGLALSGGHLFPLWAVTEYGTGAKPSRDIARFLRVNCGEPVNFLPPRTSKMAVLDFPTLGAVRGDI